MSRAITLSLFGLGLWAVVFCAVYALHGLGCAGGWAGQPGVAGLSLHRAAMVAVWVAGIGVHAWSLVSPVFGAGPLGAMPRIGAWMGAGATLFTLFPVVLAGAC